MIGISTRIQNCSLCKKEIKDLQPYFRADGQVVCYECRRGPEPEQVKGDEG